MKERPILFSGPMVRALLAGTKTQTRRVLKEPAITAVYSTPTEHKADILDLCPYGQPGDRLWVKETWGVHYHFDYNSLSELPDGRPWYKAHGAGGALTAVKKWRPSIHMPRRFSRITLEVTGVRVERLQNISEDDAKAEGIKWTKEFHPLGTYDYGRSSAKRSYQDLWESINGSGSWDVNPWVWVLTFKQTAP